jgi:hypothetical protein
MNTAVDKKLESDTFKDILGEVLGMDKVEYATILDELWNAYNTYYKSEQVDLDLIPQLIIGKKGADGKELTPEFNKQFAGYLKIIANPDNTTGIKTLVDFNRAREEYRQTMLYYGLNDLATNENIDKFIEGNVSPIEAQTRMEAAFSAVESADSILRSQLGDLNLTGKELARGLLLGKDNFKFQLKGALGWQFSNVKRTGSLFETESTDAGITLGAGAGFMYLINPKTFLNLKSAQL